MDARTPAGSDPGAITGSEDPAAALRHDPARLAVLRATGLLDTDAEPAFDRLTRLAVAVLGVPAAFLSLVDEQRDFYKAATGLPEPLATTRELAGPTFCHFAIAGAGPLVIPDTAADPLYRGVPTVQSLGVAAYVGVPLVVAGQTIGSFCAIDTAPHAWSDTEVDVLSELADSALREIALRRANDLLETERAALAAANQGLEARALELEQANLQLQEQATVLELQGEELQTASEELAERTAAAEAAGRVADEANRAKSGFLATMSHELRTPINAVIGYAQLIEMGLAGPLTEQQRGYLDRLAASSRHLLALVDEVLDLARVDAGATRVAHEDAMTGPAVRAALDLVAPGAAARGVRLVDARPDDAGVRYVGDEDRVRQVVLNLLANAIKFTAAGGTVTVTCDAAHEAPPAAAHLHGDGPWASVRVADTGVGIPPDEQGRIFEPFHQVAGGRTAYTRTAVGTGLGLAISRRLARLMGGDLSVESAPGVGSTFTLWLPTSRHEGGEVAETAADRSTRAERELSRLETPGLAEVGEVMQGAMTEVLTAYAGRLRADPSVPGGAAMTRPQLEDHAMTFLADLAQSLIIVGDTGPDARAEAAELLRDGSAIQRTIAETHGARRHAQGWDEGALRRDQRLFREEVERVVRERLRPRSADANEAVQILLGLLDRGEAIAVGAWRRAAAAPR